MCYLFWAFVLLHGLRGGQEGVKVGGATRMSCSKWMKVYGMVHKWPWWDYIALMVLAIEFGQEY